MALLKNLMVWIPALLNGVALVVTLTELANDQPGSGAEKRAQALQQLKDMLPMDILPGFVRDNFDTVAGWVIDAIVALFNRTGFFQRSAPA